VIARTYQKPGRVSSRLGFLILFGILGFVLPLQGGRGDQQGQKSREIALQLKWRHQFQFAGYYAADIKGFFAAEGLNVKILEGNSNRPPLSSVLSGRADFAVSDADVLPARMKGEPLVVLAAIFQHSPYILLSRHESGIRVPADLLDRSVMISGEQGAAQFLSMMKREGLPLDRIKTLPHSWNINDLISGKVDVISAYVTAEPSQMRALGAEPYSIRVSDYGVDFYGDTLVTREDVVKNRRTEVDAMIRATRLGWEYAMDHPEEMIAYILTLPGVKERGIERENLQYEAKTMAPLIRADIVEIGHVNPGRWLRMAKTYQETGVAPAPKNPKWSEGFVYEQPETGYTLISLALVISAVSFVCFMILVWNVMLRREVEQRTLENRQGDELRRLIIESALDAVIGVDHSGRIVHWNARAVSVFGAGAEKALDTPVKQFLPTLSDHVKKVHRRKGSPGARFEVEAVRADGSTFPAELSVSRLPAEMGVALNIFARDVTGQRNLEEKLRQSQKMQAIGQLAGGVAHDFNNLLTVIQGNASLLQTELLPGADHQHPLAEILTASERASSLTSQLLAFSRQQPMQATVFEANRIVEAISRMLGRLIGEDIRLETVYATPSPVIRADQSMLEQVLLNLAVNGRDAMPQGGILTIETRVEVLDEVTSKAHFRATPGNYLCIDVRDTGEGIAPENLPRIFDPFFTTREVGKGTGLGLATVFGIVEQHEGWVTVESTPGEGACFTVWIPTRNVPLSEITAKQGGKREMQRSHQGKETILLVEDEEMVRVIGRRLLTMHGYRVIEAGSGKKALEIWEERSAEIDLLLTDLVMPEGVSGHELARRLQEEKPELKVIYTSGYSAEIFRGEVAFPDDSIFIGKPYLPDDLLGTLRSALDGVALSS
jgi:two-component system cell cycle sensor histidine kinase/response regulator CckA